MVVPFALHVRELHSDDSGQFTRRSKATCAAQNKARPVLLVTGCEMRHSTSTLEQREGNKQTTTARRGRISGERGAENSGMVPSRWPLLISRVPVYARREQWFLGGAVVGRAWNRPNRFRAPTAGELQQRCTLSAQHDQQDCPVVPAGCCV